MFILLVFIGFAAHRLTSGPQVIDRFI